MYKQKKNERKKEEIVDANTTKMFIVFANQ